MATDFFERQDAARRTTTRLVVLFAMAVIVIVLSVDLLVALVLAYADLESDFGLLELARQHAIDPTVIGFVVGGTALVVAVGSAYKVLDLWGGGPVVAEHLGGRRLNGDTTVPTERRLLNVVEEMAIASGMATPPVYLLEDEEGINAFAAGYELEDAVIGVTRGTAERLSRDELQGVIAHEFSHILNGDMRLNLRLIAILHGIMVVALIGQVIFRVVSYSGINRRGSKDDAPCGCLSRTVHAESTRDRGRTQEDWRVCPWRRREEPECARGQSYVLWTRDVRIDIDVRNSPAPLGANRPFGPGVGWGVRRVAPTAKVRTASTACVARVRRRRRAVGVAQDRPESQACGGRYRPAKPDASAVRGAVGETDPRCSDSCRYTRPIVHERLCTPC